MARANGFEFIALRDAAVEALLVDDGTRRAYLQQAAAVRRLFAAILPDPAANAHARIVGVARNIAETIRSLDSAARPDRRLRRRSRSCSTARSGRRST